MPLSASHRISSFGIVNEAQQQILQSLNEDKKIRKSSIQDKQKILERKREERIDNLEDRLKALASGRSECLQFIKVVTIVASAVAAPLTGGTSLGIGLGLVIGAIGAVSEGLMQLKAAMKNKEIVLNRAEEKTILAIINETEKWVEDEKTALEHSNERERLSLEEHKAMLQDLEGAIGSMFRK